MLFVSSYKESMHIEALTITRLQTTRPSDPETYRIVHELNANADLVLHDYDIQYLLEYRPQTTFNHVFELLPNNEVITLPIKNTSDLELFLIDHPETYFQFLLVGRLDNEFMDEYLNSDIFNDLDLTLDDDPNMFDISDNSEDDDVTYIAPVISPDMTSLPQAAEDYGLHYAPRKRKMVWDSENDVDGSCCKRGKF